MKIVLLMLSIAALMNTLKVNDDLLRAPLQCLFIERVKK
jgi:hypothetical protein